MSAGLLQHSTRLRALAVKSLGDCLAAEARRLLFSGNFRDGAGQLREVDRYLVSHLAGTSHSPSNHAQTPDVLAWRSLLDGSRWSPPGSDGPFARHLSHSSIETWTEVELACLHAAAWIDLQRGDLQDRTASAARWIMSELQPDNATGRPWAAHVFLFLAERDQDMNAALYAETLIHNTLVAGSGTPEPLSAAILLDASDWIEQATKLKNESTDA